LTRYTTLVALSRSENRLSRWAVRALAAFLAVYMLGLAGIPTFIPYLTALLVVVIDGLRQLPRRSATHSEPPY